MVSAVPLSGVTTELFIPFIHCLRKVCVPSPLHCPAALKLASQLIRAARVD
jgi:hypothetical protein